MVGVIGAHTSPQGAVLYLVSWSGSDEDGRPCEDSWEPAQCLEQCPKLRKDFQKANPNWRSHRSKECHDQQLLDAELADGQLE